MKWLSQEWLDLCLPLTWLMAAHKPGSPEHRGLTSTIIGLLEERPEEESCALVDTGVRGRALRMFVLHSSHNLGMTCGCFLISTLLKWYPEPQTHSFASLLFQEEDFDGQGKTQGESLSLMLSTSHMH